MLDHIGEWSPLTPQMNLRCRTMLSIIFAQLFLITLGAMRLSVFFCSSSHSCQYCSTDVLLMCLIAYVLEHCFIILNMNTVSLMFFAARMKIWFLPSDILLLTKPPGLLITSQIAVMSSSERLARSSGNLTPGHQLASEPAPDQIQV